VLRSVTLPRHLFGEGLTRASDRLLQLTWRRGTLLEYSDVGTFHTADLANFTRGVATSRDTGLHDGWGITWDAASDLLVVTDSSPKMFWFDAASLALRREAVVRDGGVEVPWVNELEWIDGEARLPLLLMHDLCTVFVRLLLCRA
jgi:glutaminyl-peptide cyclotransferase